MDVVSLLVLSKLFNVRFSKLPEPSRVRLLLHVELEILVAVITLMTHAYQYYAVPLAIAERS